MARHKRKRRPKRTPRIRRRSAPGALPGSIVVAPDAQQPHITVLKYDNGQVEELTLKSLDQLPRQPDESHVTWVNVDGLGDARTIEELGKSFRLHTLALEDAVNVHQRAKVEEYDDHLFIVLRMVSLGEELESEQLSLFLGKGFVVTLQERRGDCFDAVRERVRKGHGRIRQLGADYLAYAIIDAIIDSYFPIVDDCGERLESLDEEIAAGQLYGSTRVLHDVRHNLLLLRRAIRPLRDELVRLFPGRTNLITEETQFYFRDCYDHSVQLIDLLDTYREMCSDLRDFYMSAVNNRMNEVMKVLTVIATIFIPLSFITGLYGMNFDTKQPWNMPELHWPFGYLFAIAVMLAVAGSMVVFFWRRGWIGRRFDEDTMPNSDDSSENSADE
jgi:magnesium transporter